MTVPRTSGIPPSAGKPSSATKAKAVAQETQDTNLKQGPQQDHERGDMRGWASTVLVSGIAVLAYAGLLFGKRQIFSTDPIAVQILENEVTRIWYYIGAATFFTALLTNLSALVFEDSQTKRQLALVSSVIKGISCHTELCIGLGTSIVRLDSFGLLFLPQRYMQWTVTTPLLIYILSRISDLTTSQILTAVVADILMIQLGLAAQMLGRYPAVALFCTSCCLFGVVLLYLWRIVQSAMKYQQKRSVIRNLHFLYGSTVFFWNVFPAAWVIGVMTGSNTTFEVLTMAANFLAKVLYSSSVMYGSYITMDQRQLQQQLEEENHNRIQMLQEMKEAIVQKDNFMSLVSHELRTPLNGIIQLSDALTRGSGGELSSKGQHYATTIKKSGNLLLNIINDILDTAALKQGKLTIKHERVDLEEVVQQVLDTMGSMAKEGVRLEKKIHPNTPHIMGDHDRVTQVLYNLVGNALKFTHKGSITIHVDPSKSGRSVILRVADTGIGIPSDKTAGIFQAFEQVDMTTTRKYGGTGLGLHIVKQLVEAHDGKISVQSEMGSGTTFTIKLPVVQPNARSSLQAEFHSQCQSLASEYEESRRDSAHSDVSFESQIASNVRRGTSGESDPMLPRTGRVSNVRRSVSFLSSSLQLAVQNMKEKDWQAAPRLPPASPMSPRPHKLPETGQLSLSAVLSGKLYSSSTLRSPGGQSGCSNADETSNLLDVSPASRQLSRQLSRALSRKDLEEEAEQDPRCVSVMKPNHSDVRGTIQILSVDDEKVNQDVLEEILTSSGYNFKRAADGVQALAMLRQADLLPDLILLDCMMPEMSGQEFCAVLRKTIPSSVLPVIMVSARTNPENIVEGLRRGSNDFICKPFKREELLARVEAQIRSKTENSWLVQITNKRQDDVLDQTMRLLKSVLPGSVITRLQKGELVTDKLQHVAVLVANIVGFSTMTQTMEMTADALSMVSNMYTSFDKLCDRFGVYKAETSGDVYMCVAGHDEDPDKVKAGSPCERMMNMARTLLDVARQIRTPSGDQLRVRIGLNCGPAYAGLVGLRCPRYCFMGDTIMTAARMEQQGFPMCIQLTEAFLVAMPNANPDMFVSLGMREIKGKGPILCYLEKSGNWQRAFEEFKIQEKEKTEEEATWRDLQVELSACQSELFACQAEVTELKKKLAASTQQLGQSGVRDLQLQAQLRERENRIQQLEHKLQEALLEVSDNQVASSQRQHQESRGESLQASGRNSPLAPEPSCSSGLAARSRMFKSFSRELTQATSPPGQSSLMDEQVADALVRVSLTSSASTPGPLSCHEASWGLQTVPDPGSFAQQQAEMLLSKLPSYSVQQLLRELNLDSYAARFEKEAIRLDMLLKMGHEGLQQLGITALGNRMRVLNGVRDLACTCLDACETKGRQPSPRGKAT